MDTWLMVQIAADENIVGGIVEIFFRPNSFLIAGERWKFSASWCTLKKNLGTSKNYEMKTLDNVSMIRFFRGGNYPMG